MAEKYKRVFVLLEMETTLKAKDAAAAVKRAADEIPGVIAIQVHANASKPEPRALPASNQS